MISRPLESFQDDARTGVLRRAAASERGFSLVELLVSISLMLVVMSALYSIFDTGLRVFSFGNEKLEVTENARLGMEKIERELRSAYPQNKGGIGATENKRVLLTWTPQRISFGNDLNGDRIVQCDASYCERIEYDVVNTAPGRYSLGRSSTLAGTMEPVVEFLDYQSVTNTGLKFRYFKSDGTTEITPDASSTSEQLVAIVRVETKLRLKGNRGDRTQTLTTDIALRNREGR